jgi:glutamine amidotransferase
VSTKIGIIDYGMGNLHSVKNALDFIGCETFISEDKTKLARADGLILPGVGAFPDAMKRLTTTQMDTFIKDIIKNKPIMGICLGMQLLFDKGYEFKEVNGLGIIEGNVLKIESNGLKVPHIGWNELTFNNNSILLDNINEKSQVYFVHSYKAVVQDKNDIIAVTDYGEKITAIVGKGNVFGCQFHPEKSGEIGLKILENFRRYVNANITGN